MAFQTLKSYNTLKAELLRFRSLKDITESLSITLPKHHQPKDVLYP
jgi:hypothetical protein